MLSLLSFTLADKQTILLATLVFSAFALPPGYVAAWLADVFEFRRGSLVRQVAISIPLSIAVLPILIYLPWRFISINAVWVLMGCVWTAFLLLAAPRLRTFRWSPLCTVGAAAVAVWFSIAMVSLPDIRSGNRMYFSVTAIDYVSRIPIASGIARQEKLPPQSPYLNTGRYVALRYHYFWPMVCGLVTAAGRGAYFARDAVIAGTIWAGIALICTIGLFVRFFQEVDPARWRPYAIAVSLLGITGVDVIPVLISDYGVRDEPAHFLPTIEWWNDQITGWIDGMLWVPHHAAALVAGLLAFLLLWRRERAAGLALAALCLASAAGMSVFVTLVIALILATWGVVEIAIKRDVKRLAGVAVAGIAGMTLAAPLLTELLAGGAPSSEGAKLIQWNIREFYFMYRELADIGLTGVITWYGAISRLFFLPLNYFMELGAYFIVGEMVVRRLWKERPMSERDRAAIVILMVSVLVATFLRSNSTTGNDLGWRGFMPAQFVLLLWAATVFDDWKAMTPKRSFFIGLLVFLGLSSTVFDLVLLRGFPLFLDSHLYHTLASEPDVPYRLGEHNYAMSQTYWWIRQHSPPSAIVQQNPDAIRHYYGLYADRAALIGAECVGYSTETTACVTTAGALRPLFRDLRTTPSTFAEICRTYPLDFLVVESRDPMWNRRGAWIWQQTPAFATEFSLVFSCGSRPIANPAPLR